MLKKVLPLTFLLGLLAGLSSCNSVPEPLQLTGDSMGSTYHVTISRLPATMTAEQAKAAIEHILTRMNETVSTYHENSEVSRFNRSTSTDWFSVSPEVVTITEESLKDSVLSQGAFDVTLEPLITLWGFGAHSNLMEERIPSETEIQAALAKTGYKKLEVRKNPPALRKTEPQITIDLSGIAVGFAADEVAEYFEKQGIHDYLVDMGGELRVKGHNPQQQPWRVAIEKPLLNQREAQRIVEMTDHAITTAGDYRNYFEKDGKRYSHIINPRTGRPIDHNLAAVTVIHESALVADGLDTLLMVLGAEQGYDLAVKEGWAVFFLVKTPEGFQEKYTPEFANFLVKENP
ncbi:FAD:protein FMN transferase [Beggiatoa leptomitoformis]|uniref:FAD:protein FMN transferase n=1 Tax=Beggiatoa leptomitoformis TaxID=288004 RepID=A0A2N9YE91_9GAMM|nr:FAD:protein FMN transferase [Beggiatoa leptomitoformis]ALG68917.1 FAD:protein FMN transferase ApbE [Beggiatoa leptomitoformis]AUI68705.1 FAD:protein FMN transferase ApbE [Beggiatoa leptomitoformis]